MQAKAVAPGGAAFVCIFLSIQNKKSLLGLTNPCFGDNFIEHPLYFQKTEKGVKAFQSQNEEKK